MNGFLLASVLWMVFLLSSWLLVGLSLGRAPGSDAPRWPEPESPSPRRP